MLRIAGCLSCAMALLALVRIAIAQEVSGTGRFGDSTWVAPSYCVEPLRDDARVAAPDHERTAETVLRTPFRVVFFPVRMVARGSEKVIGFASEYVVHPPQRVEWLGVRIGPAFGVSGTSGPAAGVSIQGHGGLGARSNLTATWSTKDTRKIHFRAAVTDRRMPLGVTANASYDYLPNRRFYGMGNDADFNKTIYLRRENAGGVGVHFGADPYRRVFGVVGISDVNVGPGYTGVPRAQDVFSPDDVPGLESDTKVIGYGVGADLASTDSRTDPTLGVHLRGRVLRKESIDEHNLDYYDWSGEARAYMPVLSNRRVIALRYVYKGVDPIGSSEEIPFYRMPSSADEVRFAGFKGNRFVDRQLMLAHAEYRWIAWRRIWADLFLQYGEVAPYAEAFKASEAHRSIGGGLRTRLSGSTSARLEIGHSHEGTAVYLDLKGDF
jgi:outer membrane protein assembly factor BamA